MLTNLMEGIKNRTKRVLQEGKQLKMEKAVENGANKSKRERNRDRFHSRFDSSKM